VLAAANSVGRGLGEDFPVAIAGALIKIKAAKSRHWRLAYRAAMVKATSWRTDSRAATEVNKFPVRIVLRIMIG
jgi:hypothetical protein